MSRGFEAIKTVVIDASRVKVWDVLTNPAKVKQCMHGTDMSTDWTVGSPIIWQGEWKGQSYVDKGTVLAFEPERLLKTTHWSPMGGIEDAPENYHTVTHELAEDGGRMTLTLTQDNNATQKDADNMAENNWGRCCKASRQRPRGRRPGGPGRRCPSTRGQRTPRHSARPAVGGRDAIPIDGGFAAFQPVDAAAQ